jgi:hypothetical protein
MVQACTRLTSRIIHNVALAYFATSKGLNDAARDLCTAGFETNNINISRSNAQREREHATGDGTPLPNAIGTHSLRWLCRQILAHDSNRSGADQISGLDRTPTEGINPTCSTLDLPGALMAMGVPLEVLSLLQRDAEHSGMFMMIDASDRVNEASVIMSGNGGYIRTGFLTVGPA